MSAQQQTRKMLEKLYGFEFIGMKATGFGERWQMRSSDGEIEAQVGAHRICFYGFKSDRAADEINLKNSLPTNIRPLCFDIDEKTNIRAFLDKVLNVKSGNTRQKALFAEI